MKPVLPFVLAAAAVSWSAALAGPAAPDDHAHDAAKHTAAGDDTMPGMQGDEHAMHKAMMNTDKKSSRYTRTLESYSVSKVMLKDQNGADVRLDQLLSDDRPTLVQFIFTSCSTICPVMAAVFSGAQEGVAARAPDYQMISISIDPEYDTPARLRAFGEKYGAKNNWTLLTGSEKDIKSVIKEFDVLYQGDNKMYHQPYTFIRWPNEQKWVRLRGLMSVSDLVKEFDRAKTGE